jgi:hypothetical protein
MYEIVETGMKVVGKPDGMAKARRKFVKQNGLGQRRKERDDEAGAHADGW